MNLFEKVFKALNKEKVQYLVVGGVAVNLYGYVRFTGDLDLLLLLDPENLKKMHKVMKGLGYYERLPVSVKDLGDRKKVELWTKTKNLKAFTFCPPKDNPLQIDVVMDESLRFDKLVKKSVKKSFDNVTIPVVSVDDLIRMKKVAGREKDLADIEFILRLKDL